MSDTLFEDAMNDGSIANKAANESEAREPNDHSGRCPIFIIGSPRSGTTALAVALKSHPDLWAGVEARFIHGLLRTEIAGRVYREATSTPGMWLTVEGVHRDEWFRALGVAIDSIMSSRAGGRRWIDHAPRNTSVVDSIATAFPDAQFIHIVRDGRRVVESLLAVARRPGYSGFGGDFAENCLRWVERVSQGRQFHSANPQRCIQVRNEDLSDEPHAGFKEILRFLGASPHPGPAESWSGPRVNSSFDKVERPRGPWGDLDQDQRNIFIEIAGQLLVELEYCSRLNLRV